MSIKEAKSEYTTPKVGFSLVHELTGTSVPTTDRVIIVPRLEKASAQFQTEQAVI
jgi:hypothetical protein